MCSAECQNQTSIQQNLQLIYAFTPSKFTITRETCKLHSFATTVALLLSDLLTFVADALLFDQDDGANRTSRFEGSNDSFCRTNSSRSKPLPLPAALPSPLSAETPPNCSLAMRSSAVVSPFSKLRSLFMLSTAGSMMSRNPMIHEASSTISVRWCKNRTWLFVSRLVKRDKKGGCSKNGLPAGSRGCGFPLRVWSCLDLLLEMPTSSMWRSFGSLCWGMIWIVSLLLIDCQLSVPRHPKPVVEQVYLKSSVSCDMILLWSDVMRSWDGTTIQTWKSNTIVQVKSIAYL